MVHFLLSVVKNHFPFSMVLGVYGVTSTSPTACSYLHKHAW